MTARWLASTALLLVLHAVAHAAGEGGVLVSAGGGTIHRFVDTNGDGDAYDAGERLLWAGGLTQAGNLATSGDRVLAVDRPIGAIVAYQDLNGDGDALDAGEQQLWADELGDPCGIVSVDDGVVLISSEADGVLWRIEDITGDGDALDAGEVVLYAEGLATPTALGVTPNGDVLVCTSGPASLVRLCDLNGDGDALDAGELLAYAPALGEAPSAEVLMPGSACVLVSVASAQAVYCVADRNGDGDALDAAEVTFYADDPVNGLAQVLAACPYGSGVLMVEHTGEELTWIRDLNGDGDALDVPEVLAWADGVAAPYGICPEPAGSPESAVLEIAASLDIDWVYENAPVRTCDRHHVVLSVEITGGELPGEAYDMALSEDGGPLADFQCLDDVLPKAMAGAAETVNVYGRRFSSNPAGRGMHRLGVAVTGRARGQTATAAVDLALRQLGDVDGDGSTDLTDAAALNDRINSVASPYSERAYDLNGDGSPDLTDRALLNDVINSVVID